MSALVVSRQTELQRHYRETPKDALIIERARTSDGARHDPFHGHLEIGGGRPGGVPELGWEFGIHAAVGGDHDLPNPGHVLLGALAACMDSTLRMLAERFGIGLEELEVTVDGHIDVRGALMVSNDAPVGFQDIRCHVALRTEEGVPAEAVKRLVAAAERSYIVLQTLRNGVSVTTDFAAH